MEQQYIALSATKDKRSVSLRGKIRNIGAQKLDEIFLKNTYMQKIYPGDTKAALEVFQIYEAEGEYFDISDPSHVVRDPFVIGKVQVKPGGYFITSGIINTREEDVKNAFLARPEWELVETVRQNDWVSITVRKK